MRESPQIIKKATNAPLSAVPAMTALLNKPAAELPSGVSEGFSDGGGEEEGGEEIMLGVGAAVCGAGADGGVVDGAGDGLTEGEREGEGLTDGVGEGGEDTGEGGEAVGEPIGDRPGACAMQEVASKARISTTASLEEPIFIYERGRERERRRY